MKAISKILKVVVDNPELLDTPSNLQWEIEKSNMNNREKLNMKEELLTAGAFILLLVVVLAFLFV